MKRLVVLLSILLMITSMAFSQSTPVKPQPKTKAEIQTQMETQNKFAPEITFEKVIHDYGVIKKGDNGKCAFKFTNTGKEPLILSRPRSNCGCTVPTWPRQPILPGKSEVITVIYDTKRIGPIRKNVTVFSNAKNNAVVLRIKGTVKHKN